MSLEQKIREVLARLSTLSEASGSTLQPLTSHGSSTSRVPKGVAEKTNLLTVPTDRPPSKERSLYDWWCWRFAKAITDGESEFDRYRLCLIAEREYAERKYRSPERTALRSGEITVNDVDGGAAERRQAERVIEFYEGVSAVEVAVHERQTEAWVKKARRQQGRNAGDGRPRAAFYDLNEHDRRKEVEGLAVRMGQKKAADHLGVAKSTVQRYWPAEPIAA